MDNTYKNLPKKYYDPSDSMEHYDEETNTWYNKFGQVILDPSDLKENWMDQPFIDGNIPYDE